MLKKFFLLATALVVLFILGGVMLPSTYNIEERIVINASVEEIDPFVSNLNAWEKWTPWNAQDPSMKTQILQATGVGASQKWSGQSGEGRLVFTHIDPKKGVDFELFFDKEHYRCLSGLRYEPLGAKQTRVVWYMKGSIDAPVVGGYVAALTQSMGSNAYKKGLEQLKKVVERQR